MSKTPLHPVVEYLRSNTVESLQGLGIYAKRSTQNPAKFSLNYDQIEAADGHPLVNLCRGLVLRDPRSPGGDYEVFARPFPRFYNLGSGHAAPMDWSTAVFEEKLDGTCCIVYFDPDLVRWCVATRNVPDADQPNHSGETFSDLFWRHYDSVTELGKVEGAGPLISRAKRVERQRSITYVFELTGPGNQIVVPYDDWKTTLLAAFVTATGEELAECRSAPVHEFLDLETARFWLEKQPGHKNEGFVVRDGAGNRVKVKSGQYLAISKVITTAGSELGLLSVVLSGTADDVRGFLPKERGDKLDEYAHRYAKFVSSLEQFAAALPADADRKTVALSVKDSAFAHWIGTVLDLWVGTGPKYARWADWLEAERKKNTGQIGSSVVERIFRSLPDVGGAA